MWISSARWVVLRTITPFTMPEGRKLDGDYHATGYGLSMEYGKRFGTAAGYVEPQIQLLFSRLGSADYDAVSDFDGDKKMHVHQDSMSSFIGRLGIAAGRATEKATCMPKQAFFMNLKATQLPLSARKEKIRPVWNRISAIRGQN